MREEEFLSLLRLSGVRGLGPHRIARLIARFGSATAVLKQQAELLVASDQVNPVGAQAILDARRIKPPARILQRFLQPRPGERITLITDADYPPLLRRISQPPLWLWTSGSGSFDDAPRVAMVGSRSATRWGEDLTRAWSYRLAAAGITIVSGLAEGIDAAAHQGALDAGGKTWAVMGTGLGRVYPRANRSLASDISRSGMLITEFQPGVGARAHHFPQRNRIIAGLSHATIVMEAAKGSGSLITAEMAQDEGRDVGIVPGRPGDRNAAGTNSGIRENIGEIVTDVDDILAMLMRNPDLTWRAPSHEQPSNVDSASGPEGQKARRRAPIRRTTPSGKVRSALQGGASTLDDLQRDTDIPRAELEEILLDLLLEGRIILEQDDRYRWRR